MPKVSEIYPDPPPSDGRCSGGEFLNRERYLWFTPLDGLGEECLDIFTCRRYRLAYFGQRFGDYVSEYTLEFYLTPDKRWMRLRGDSWTVEGDEEGTFQSEYIETLQEVDPIEVAHELLSRDWLKGRLPQELEKFREYGDTRRYSEWWGSKLDNDGDSIGRTNLLPSWDRDRKVLSVGDYICREFRRGLSNQIKLIEAFDDAQWQQFITDPFKNESRLNETVKSFNRETRGRGFQFIR
ncbi:MAG TPA: hypothetical protein VJY33_08365, partial [Isosphaeraceae bacterium]|nr:hypothetical protein [Isosphaeraceae bacterium]